MADRQKSDDKKEESEQREIKEQINRDLRACEILRFRILEELRAYRDWVNQPLSFDNNCNCEICQRDFPSNCDCEKK